jgi:hypothetical protein
VALAKLRTITEENQKTLQKFCFETRFFRMIKKDPLFDDIPIIFVSDFEKIKTLSFYVESWAKCLTSLLPNTVILDLEQAQADAFNAMGKLENEYRILDKPKGDIDLDDDEELYSFIDEYNSLTEKQGGEFSRILGLLYELKGRAVNRIVNEFGVNRFVMLNSDAILIAYRNSEDRDKISEAYRNDFYLKGLEKISGLFGAIGAGLDMEILGLLDSKMSEPGLKTSIRTSIQHERDLVIRQSGLKKAFYSKLNEKLNATDDSYQIQIIDPAPFAFLKSPFPEM